MTDKKKKFNSKVIHSGHGADESTGAVMPPIHLSSTFKQKSPGDFKYEYARTGNPTRDILEKLLAEIENGKYGFAFSSGMAAISALSDALGNNYSIISSDDVYGGTRRIFDKIKSVNQDIIIVCDNTFASPYNQQPINYGADITIHSSTKYLGGHSDIIGGALIINNNPELAAKIKYIQNAVGSVPSPFDCYLLIRSIKTLAVRMERHNTNALEVAKYLSEHPKINNVFYPGLENDFNNNVAKKQMNGFGGIVSIEIKGNVDSAKKFLENIQIFTLAESLGGVESLIEHPAIMTHASIDKKIREELGITDTLIRLSIGIEDVDDLKRSLDEALAKI